MPAPAGELTVRRVSVALTRNRTSAGNKRIRSFILTSYQATASSASRRSRSWLPCCLPPTRNEVGILIYGLFAAQSPRPPMPLSTLQETSHDVPCKTRGQDGFATSLPVGLLHPLQHAGLSRRSPVCPSSAKKRESLSDRSRKPFKASTISTCSTGP